VLSVGDLQPRKNQIGLIRAFALLLKAHPSSSKTWYWPQGDMVRRSGAQGGARFRVADRIQFCGFVSDADLLLLYNACDLFCFPVVLRRLRLAGAGSHGLRPGGDLLAHFLAAGSVDGAAILFDPYALDEIVRALADLLLDGELRLRMERLGLQRAAHFSWQKTAERTLAVFHEVLEERRATAEVYPQPIAHR